MDQLWLRVGFSAFVLVMLAVDLLVFHKEAHEVRFREAATQGCSWGGSGSEAMKSHTPRWSKFLSPSDSQVAGWLIDRLE